jgi:hypothetical protein
MLVDPFSTKKPSEQIYQNLLKLSKPKPQNEQQIAILQLVTLSGMVLTNYPIRLYSLQSIRSIRKIHFWRSSFVFFITDFGMKYLLEKLKVHAFLNVFLGYEWYRYTIISHVSTLPFQYQMIQPWALLFLLDNYIQNYTTFMIKRIVPNKKPKKLLSWYPLCFHEFIAMSLGTLVTLPIEAIFTTFIIESIDTPMLDIVSLLGFEFWKRVGDAFLWETACRCLTGLITMEVSWYFIHVI